MLVMIVMLLSLAVGTFFMAGDSLHGVESLIGIASWIILVMVGYKYANLHYSIPNKIAEAFKLKRREDVLSALRRHLGPCNGLGLVITVTTNFGRVHRQWVGQISTDATNHLQNMARCFLEVGIAGRVITDPNVVPCYNISDDLQMWCNHNGARYVLMLEMMGQQGESAIIVSGRRWVLYGVQQGKKALLNLPLGCAFNDLLDAMPLGEPSIGKSEN